MSAELRRHEETQKAPDNVNTTADSEIDREEELMLQAETQALSLSAFSIPRAISEAAEQCAQSCRA